ncbi:hypothetical protein MKW94_022719 [Papaver nudicaule]|uniref:PWI domain-containing protein n=1 Tax=Papaver nudicaule TaxID=74823 RepID=A0AA41UWA0_PAPNU|nr:hypothetical protein [Papaver nudicaule]
MMPMTKEVFHYEINWEVADKYALHEKMRPWLSNIAKNSTDAEADDIVSDILKSMKHHCSALSIHDKIMFFRLVSDDESEKLFRNIWAKLFSEIKKLEEVNGKKPLGVEIFIDTPKTKEEVLSLEINWAVFDQHELHDKMRPWIRRDVKELLKTEKASVVDQVVGGIRNQNPPSEMLKLLEPSLDDNTETVVRILWRTLLILVKIFETENCQFLKFFYLHLISISEAFIFSFFETGFAAEYHKSRANPNSKLSNAKGKKNMSSDNNLGQQDPVWKGEESNDRVRDVIKRNRCYSYPSFWHQKKRLDFRTLCEANRLGNAIPRNIEKLSSYVVDWAVSDKEELHNQLRPWIFREIMDSVRKEDETTRVVDSIVSGIKDHANAKDILELAKPTLGDRSAIFVVNLLMKLIFGIQLAETTGLGSFPAIDRERSAKEKVKVSQYGDRYSRNRHFMMVAFDYENLLKLKGINETMPKTKAELFSYGIKWDVYEKHGLQKNMRAGIWLETLELIRQKQEAGLVDEQIMWSIFDYHVSASQREFIAQEKAIPVFEEIMCRLQKDRACPSEMVEYLEPILGSGSEKIVMKMWYALICGIKLAEDRVEKKLKEGWGSMVLLPVVHENKGLGRNFQCSFIVSRVFNLWLLRFLDVNYNF